ncbi:hypothetical protein CAEBREN_01496 [Caenorhabditis brenneri]|uniref:Uncharacterized protein n=1 Tax=Caenorhabditis brenneri TaxID=135651 RepID=G0MWM6_CAEBE|nr:hypothetical protein CAEBREN_01496 [Caenorhabditis brenneri]
MVPLIRAPADEDSAFCTIFYHLATLWCMAGCCVMIKTWGDYYAPGGFALRSEEVHRMAYGLGSIGLIICACFQMFAFWYIPQCFWTGYTIYVVFHIISFCLLRFALFPGAAHYRIQYKHYMEYFLCIVFVTGFSTEFIAQFMDFEKSWTILIFYNFFISVALTELHAVFFVDFADYEDIKEDLPK